MRLLRSTRAELAGAWRSLRYDLGRRRSEPTAGGPDVTSTGMNTFSLDILAEDPHTGFPIPDRPPRRAAAVTALSLLTVVGAAGAYLGVVNGLGSLMSETPAAADTFPQQAVATSQARIGRGPAPRHVTRTRTGVKAVPPAPGPADPKLPAVAPAPPRKTTPDRAASPVRTAKPTSPDCACSPGGPPVPTPTAPTAAPSPTPSAPPTKPGSPSAGESSATPSASPSRSTRPRHRRWH